MGAADTASTVSNVLGDAYRNCQLGKRSVKDSADVYKAITVSGIFDDALPDVIASLQSGCMSQDVQRGLRSSQGDVHPAHIGQESDTGYSRASANAGKNDDGFFLTLEAVHGIEVDDFRDILAELRFEFLPKFQ